MVSVLLVLLMSLSMVVFVVLRLFVFCISLCLPVCFGFIDPSVLVAIVVELQGCMDGTTIVHIWR